MQREKEREGKGDNISANSKINFSKHNNIVTVGTKLIKGVKLKIAKMVHLQAQTLADLLLWQLFV